jgi:hypothetical protein
MVKAINPINIEYIPYTDKQMDRSSMMKDEVLVAREQELAQLDAFLN